jgi:LPS-assembly protein
VKKAAVGALLAAAVGSQAQSLPHMGRALAKTLAQRTPQAQPGQEQPLPPANPKRGKELKLIQSETYTEEGRRIEASGGVELSYEGYDIRAEKVVGDKETQVFVLQGKASIEGNETQIEGETIEVDFRRRVFRYLNATAMIPPSQIGGEMRGNLYVSGQGGLGTSREVRTERGSLTTCDLENPHFRLKARDILVVPEKYARLRDVELTVLGASILKLPFLIIPLTRDAQRYWPEFGQSPDEGYYLKAKFGTPLRGQDYLDHRLDLMEKKGVGFGTDWIYEDRRRMAGRASLYLLNGPNPSTQLGLDHSQKLGRGDLNLSGQYQENNYLTAPRSTLLSSRAQYVVPWFGGSTRLSYQRTSSETSGFSSVNDGWSVNDTRRFGQAINTSLDVNFARQTSQGLSGFSQESSRIDLRFSGQGQFRAFNADLQYQRAIPVSGDSRFLGSGNRTPLLTLRSSSEKLFGRPSTRLLPANFEASVGELFDPGVPNGITRMTFQSDVRQNIGQGPVTATVGGRFNQGLYSDDTAQYVLNYDASMRWGFARESSLNVNYRNLRGFGFTPLSIDRTGRNDLFSADLSYRPWKSLSLSGSTGYDILQSSRGFVPWQSVSLRADWQPVDTATIRLASFYDTFSAVWSTFSLDADLRYQGARFILGARYDGRRKELAGATLTAAGMRWGRLSTSILADYNGFSKMVESLQYQLIYDLHCTEAVLEVVDNKVGFRSGSQIGFFIRLKAFPSFSPFGIGRRGQAIGSASGFGG